MAIGTPIWSLDLGQNALQTAGQTRSAVAFQRGTVGLVEAGLKDERHADRARFSLQPPGGFKREVQILQNTLRPAMQTRGWPSPIEISQALRCNWAMRRPWTLPLMPQPYPDRWRDHTTDATTRDAQEPGKIFNADRDHRLGISGLRKVGKSYIKG